MSTITQADIDEARTAILAAIVADAGIVEFEIGGRRVSKSPQLALLALERLQEQVSQMSSTMADRRSIAGRRR